MQILKNARNAVLMLLGLPTPDETKALIEAAEELDIKLIRSRYETIIARIERDALRERLANMTKAVPGPWKITKDGTKRWRRWEHPRSASMWRTESEPIEPKKRCCDGSGCD